MCPLGILSYSLTYVTPKKMMAERASIVDRSTLPRWAIRLMPLLDKEFAGRGGQKLTSDLSVISIVSKVE